MAVCQSVNVIYEAAKAVINPDVYRDATASFFAGYITWRTGWPSSSEG